jgi:flavorubredoxin
MSVSMYGITASSVIANPDRQVIKLFFSKHKKNADKDKYLSYKNMKISIIYESHFGNNKKLVEDLAGVLRSKKQHVKIFSVKNIAPDEVQVADLYIFSSPTRRFTLPPDMSNFLDNFNPPAKHAKYALLTTYMDPRTIALKKMTTRLEEKEMKKATDDFKVRISGLKGPIKEDYTDRLKIFAEELIK